MKRKLLCILLALCTVLALLPLTAFAAGSIPGTTGKGTSGDPVVVDTFSELKAALQSEDNLYIVMNSQNDIRQGLSYCDLVPGEHYEDNEAAIVIPAGTTKHLCVNAHIDYRANYLNRAMDSFIANMGTLYLSGTGSICVGFNSYSLTYTNAIVHNVSGTVYSEGISMRTGYSVVTCHAHSFVNSYGTLVIKSGSYDGDVNRVGGGYGYAVLSGSMAQKTEISGGDFWGYSHVDNARNPALIIKGQKNVILSGGSYSGGIMAEPSGKTADDYLADGYVSWEADSILYVTKEAPLKTAGTDPFTITTGKTLPTPTVSGSKYYLDCFDWIDGDGHDMKGSTAQADKIYRLSARLRTNAGLLFAPDCVFTFGKNKGTVQIFADKLDAVNYHCWFAPGVTMQDITISGKVGKETTSYVLAVDFQGVFFVSNSFNDVSSWIPNLPAGLTAKLAAYGMDGKNIRIIISGTPTEACSEPIKLIIPGDANSSGHDLVIGQNVNAKFSIAGDGWTKNSDNKWVYYENGALKTGWLSYGGKWYYLGKDGIMSTGWKSIGGKWYYMNSSGVMQTGWVKSGGKWYYMNSSGAMQTGWIKSGGKWYYLESLGAMLTGWQKISGKWYYLGTDGAMATGWQKISSKWYYLGTDGAMVTGWQKISGIWYYFESSGAMKTGWYKESGKWYYLKSSGAMACNETITVSGKSYSFNSSGVCTNP